MVCRRPKAFRLLASSSPDGPWEEAVSTSNATNDGCTSAPGKPTDGVWTNAELTTAMASCDGTPDASAGCRDVVGWLDQRAWGTTMELAALKQSVPPHPLLQRCEEELAALHPAVPAPAGDSALAAVPAEDWTQSISMLAGAATATFDAAGAMSGLHTAQRGLDYADANHLLFETVVHVSNPAQRKAWAGAYMTDVNAASEFFKTGDEYGDGKGYRPTVVGMWKNASCVLLVSSHAIHQLRVVW